MLLHVANNLIDGIEHGDLASLRCSSLNQALRRQGIDHAACLCYGRLKECYQFLASHPAIGVKLPIPDTNVCCATDAMHDPLTHVAAQMQNQVSDCILVGFMALPYLRIVQLIEAGS